MLAYQFCIFREMNRFFSSNHNIPDFMNLRQFHLLVLRRILPLPFEDLFKRIPLSTPRNKQQEKGGKGGPNPNGGGGKGGKGNKQRYKDNDEDGGAGGYEDKEDF
jgi:hypothetical protein